MRPSTHGAAPRLTVAARSHLEATHLEQRERRVRKVIEVAELRVDPDARALVARLAVNVSSATVQAVFAADPKLLLRNCLLTYA